MDKLKTETRYDGQVVLFTLNAPKANIFDEEMMAELRSELEQIGHDVKLIQFTGAGEHFSFGASVSEHRKENAAQMLNQFHGIFKLLMSLAVPTMALVSGQCLGGGFELALACNFLFLDKTAKLGQPEINLGVFAPPASLILPLKVGQTKADDLLLTGRTIGADEAMTWGMGTQLFENRLSLDEGSEKWLQKYILPKSASSLRYAIRAARTEFNKSLSSNLDNLAQFYTEDLMGTYDANEGINAFLEKRKPNWKNC